MEHLLVTAFKCNVTFTELLVIIFMNHKKLIKVLKKSLNIFEKKFIFSRAVDLEQLYLYWILPQMLL